MEADEFFKEPIRAEQAWFQSGPMDVEPFGYYRLTFASKAENGGMWAAVFYDAHGRQLDADHYSGFDPSTDWIENEFCFRARANASAMRLRFQPTIAALYVYDVEVHPIARPAVAEWADRVAGAMPPLDYTPPEGRWAHLPRTKAKLGTPGVLRIVMLGDSIVNDTGNSAFDVLVERAWPPTRVEVVTAVRGGTGCWHYQEPGRVQEYVLGYGPDVVMIGGISHKDDAEAIRSVVHQVREGCEADILVMTGAFGKGQDPRELAEWEPTVDPAGPGYRSALLRLALDEDLEFIDVRGAWGSYLVGVAEPYGWFMRDEVHANCRGRQVLARILERYFAP